MGIARAVFHLQGNDSQFPSASFLAVESVTKMKIDFSRRSQNEIHTSCAACPTRLIPLCSVLDRPKRNRMKIFAARLKLALNALTRSEFKMEITMILRINDCFNAFLSLFRLKSN